MANDLDAIRTTWRKLTGRGSTGEITDDNIRDLYINPYYRENFPLEVDVHAILADYTADAIATDDGEFALADTTLDINQPIFANEFELVFVHGSTEFFLKYPEDQLEHFITKPTLVIGTGDTAQVKNAAFKYRLSDWSYEKASAESALTGSNVPQSTYGAWILSVDVDGAITVTAAANNATGYATAALAIRGIVLPGAAIMGFVTVIDTSGAFVPDTTALTGGGVTATFTDGNPGLRNIPQDACITNGKLYIRPKPFDAFLIRATASLATPTALSAGSDAPTDATWAPAIATGSAMKFLSDVGEVDRIPEIIGDRTQPIPGTHYHNIQIINRKRIKQDSERQTIRSF